MIVERIVLRCLCGERFIRYAHRIRDWGNEYNRMMGGEEDKQCPMCKRQVNYTPAFARFPTVDIGTSILVWDEREA